MIKYRIQKLRGKDFILKAGQVKGKAGTYELWYKEDKFWHKWIFIGFIDDINTIQQTIHYHFGFTAVIHQIS